MRRRKLLAADLFCGAGGATNGLVAACERLGVKADVVAVNHWPVAVETHARNHPDIRHLCEDLESVNPRKVVPGGRLDLLLAGPECTHHSTARGGKPVNDQSRASAWCVLRWATALQIDAILIENVREFQTWAPLGSNGRPLKSRRGDVFRSYLDAFRALGYKVDYRVLNAADYGDPTTRERLFIQCRRGRKPIAWPDPTHTSRRANTLFGPLRAWRTAREIIDWSIPSKSIFCRKRPLRPNTLARIAAGLKKFGGPAAEPFLVLLNGGGRQGAGGAKSVDEPVPAITAGGEHVGVCQPFILPQFGESTPRSVDRPLGAVTTTSRGIGLVEPFILPPEGVYRGNAARSADDPLQTVTSRGGGQLVEPFLIPTNYGERPGQSPRTHSLDSPMPTVVGSVAHAIVEPFLIPLTHAGGPQRCIGMDNPAPTLTGSRELALVEAFMVQAGGPAGKARQPQGIDEPMRTLLAENHTALVQPFVMQMSQSGSNGDRLHDAGSPLPTVTTADDLAVVQPYLVKYNGTAHALPLGEPLDALTTRDRFALVIPGRGEFEIDIRFRMLQPRELARAHSFPDAFAFVGRREDVVKQIGNSWPNKLGEALCEAILT